MQLIRKSLLAAAMLGLIGGSALADSTGLLDMAGNYNAFVFTALVEDGGSSEGALASGGFTGLNDFQTAAGLSSGINLVSDDSLTLTGGSVNGDVFAAQGGTATCTNITGTVYYSCGVFAGADSEEYEPMSDIPINFSCVEDQLIATSNDLLTLPAKNITSDPSDPTDLTLVGTSSGQNVFDLDDTVLDAVTGTITITLPLGATAVINVINTQGSDYNDTIQATKFVFDPSAVLWNFNSIDSLTFDSFSGSILAPNAVVSMTGGTFDGTVVADVLDGTGNTLLTPGSGTTVIVVAPLPSALWAGLVLLTGLGIHRRFVCR